jgi:hypothetical protein
MSLSRPPVIAGEGRFEPSKKQFMVIVAGHIVVDPQQRESSRASSSLLCTPTQLACGTTGT